MPAPSVSPKLARVERVELVRTGTWQLSTGECQFSREDLAAAISALDCPAVHRPHIKIGHVDPRWDGEPALGWVANLGLANSGNTLVGDLVGMPAWLGDVAASAYPQRSVEGLRNYRCQIGHRHPLVITAVALLGVTPPGVGTLASLQDHPSLTEYTRALYDVAASGDDDLPGGEPVIITYSREDPVPQQGSQPFAAAVSVDDIRDAFYEGAPQNLWIIEVQVVPQQLIVTSGGDDDAIYRIPYMLNGDDDDEAVTFGTPVPVEVVYQDTAPDPSEIGPVGVAAAAGEVKPPTRRAAFARRGTSQPVAASDEGAPASEPMPKTDPTPTAPPPEPAGDPAPVVPEPPEPAPADAPVDPAAEPDTTTEPEEGDDVSLEKFRSALGLSEDADVDSALAAIEALKAPKQPDPEMVAAAAQRDQAVAAMKGELERVSGELATIKAEKARNEKAAFFAAAVQSGRIKPADRQAWESRYDKDPTLVREIVNAFAAGSAVPVQAAGYVGDPEPDGDAEFEAAIARLDGPYAKKEN